MAQYQLHEAQHFQEDFTQQPDAISAAGLQNTCQILSAILLISAALLLLLPSFPVFLIAAMIGTAIGAALIYLVIDEAKALRLSWIVSGAILIAYGGGSVSTWISSTSVDDFFLLAKNRPIDLLCEALALSYICCAIAVFAGRFETPVFTTDDIFDDEGFAVLLSFASLALVAIAYFNGELGYEGVIVDPNTQRISVLGAIARLISAPTVGLTGFLYGKSSNKFVKLSSALCCAGLLAGIIPAGRREIFLALLMLAFGYSLSGELRKRSWAQKLILVITVSAVGYFVSKYFYAIRLSVSELGATSSLSDQLSLAFEFFTSSSLEERFNALFFDNLRERTFVLGYLADLIEATHSFGPLYGATLFYYLRISVPAVLDPSKSDVLEYQQVENFVHPKLGLPIIDQANTILTDGVTDFSLIGACVYLLALIGFLYGSLWLLRRLNQPVTVLISILTIIHLALKPEITLSDYLVTVRNLAWIMPISFAIEWAWRTRGNFREPS